MKKHTVFIVGAGGMVGATAAHALALTETVREIALIDVAEDLVAGQAADINHATAFTRGVRVRVGAYDEIAEDDIVVITSGVPRKPGQTRLELMNINASIMRDVVTKVMRAGRPGFIVVVANPVDVMTHVAWQTSGLPKERVFGTGTMLDTARLRVALANALNVSVPDVHAFILGEHGDSSFAALSSATVGGVAIADLPGYQPELVANIEQEIRQTAANIIAAKKSTYYGISNVVVKIVQALGHRDATVLPVCSVVQGEYGLDDVVLGLPSLMSSYGVRILDRYPLSAPEREKLEASAAVVKEATSHLA